MQAPEDDEPGLEIAPLIDVSFLLLIYFLVTSTLEKREADLGLTLPTENPDSSAVQVEIDQMMIVVDPDGASRELEGLAYRPKDYLVQQEWPYQPLSGIISVEPWESTAGDASGASCVAAQVFKKDVAFVVPSAASSTTSRPLTPYQSAKSTSCPNGIGPPFNATA